MKILDVVRGREYRVSKVERRELEDRARNERLIREAEAEGRHHVVLNYVGEWTEEGVRLDDGHIAGHGSLWEFLTRYRYMLRLANITDHKGRCILRKDAVRLNRVLEYGADWGHCFSVFEPHFNEVHGIEPMKECVERAHNNGLESLVRGIMEVTPYPDEFFDVILSTHVLEHGASPSKVLKEMYRILRFDGWAVHTLPCYIDGSRISVTDIHPTALSASEWRAAFIEHGFTVIRDFWMWNHDNEDWTIVARKFKAKREAESE